MILMIDNYDSFTYNLVEYLKMLKREVLVYRNDAITIKKILELNPEVIVISPGPCTPKESGISQAIIKQLKGKIPILGICLGHQVIAEGFGGAVVKAMAPVHGKTSFIKHDGKGIFKNLNNPLKVTRYHSLVVKPQTIPACLEISAQTDSGEIMALRHKSLPIASVQFHPEAILTEQGLDLLENFLKIGELNDH